MASYHRARTAKLSRLATMLVEDAEAVEILEGAGFDLENEDDQLLAAAVYDTVREMLGLPEPEGLSPVRKAVHAGRNDPCPCGSGRKYKKCCLSKAPAGASRTGSSLPRIPAEMFPPMMDEDGLAGHLDQLPELFEEVAELREVSFDVAACAEHARANRAAFKKKEKKDEWEAHRWIAAEYLADHDESMAFTDCADAAREAAPHYRDRPDVFRTLVVVVLVAESLAGADDAAHADPGLGTFLFWWTLEGAVDGMAALGDLLAEKGGDSMAGALEMLQDRSGLEEMAQRIETVSPKGWQMLKKLASKELDRIADALAGAGFPVRLPAVCFAPWFVRLVGFVPLTTEPSQIHRELDRRKSEILDAVKEECDKLVEEASPEDMRLAAEILGEWLDSKVGRKHKQRQLVELVRGHLLIGTSFPFWGDWMAGALATPSPSFASWEAVAVNAWLERATPDALEKHGDLLAQHGYPGLARRMWECCARLGPVPDSVRQKLDRGKP